MWGFVCVLVCIGYLICYGLIKLSGIATASIIISVLLFIFVMFDASFVKKARKKMKEDKKYRAKLIDINEIKGYKAKRIYTFELEINGNKYTVVKELMHKHIGINEVMDVYPIYDSNEKVIDFDYCLEEQSKPLIWLIVAAIISGIITIFLVLNDGLNILDLIGDYILGILLVIFLLIMGTHSLKRYLGSKHSKLIPVEGKIIGFVGHHSIDNGIYIDRGLSPIYQVIINGETYQFLGDKFIARKDSDKYINTKQPVYYDKETMEFFDKKNDRSTLCVAIMLLSFAIIIIISMFK